MINTQKAITVQQFSKMGLESFCLIDIRQRQSYIANHIKNSINLPTKEDITQYLIQKDRIDVKEYKATPAYIPQIPLLICFSSHRARMMAYTLQDSIENDLYMQNICYLDCGIMELGSILQQTIQD